LSGDIGRHGIAIMAVREGLEFETPIASDCASVSGAVQALLAAGIGVHCLRDATRGGLASTLVEIATASGCGIHVSEDAISVHESVQGACEILGFDPLYVANEGRFVAFVAAADADRAVDILRRHPGGAEAARIGRTTTEDSGLVILQTRIGASRLVDLLSGEQLPRIC
jgi:hydrogenase expression/formation protein HypE